MKIDDFNWENFKRGAIGVACYGEGSAKLFLHKALCSNTITKSRFDYLIELDYTDKEKTIFWYSSYDMNIHNESSLTLSKIYLMTDMCIIRDAKTILSNPGLWESIYKGTWTNLDKMKRVDKLEISEETIRVVEGGFPLGTQKIVLSDLFIKIAKRKIANFDTIRSLIEKDKCSVFESRKTKNVYRIAMGSRYARLEKWNDKTGSFEPANGFTVDEVFGIWDLIEL